MRRLERIARALRVLVGLDPSGRVLRDVLVSQELEIKGFRDEVERHRLLLRDLEDQVYQLEARCDGLEGPLRAYAAALEARRVAP